MSKIAMTENADAAALLSHRLFPSHDVPDTKLLPVIQWPCRQLLVSEKTVTLLPARKERMVSII